MVKVGDIVIYKPSNDTPSRTDAAVHPAIVTMIHPSQDGKMCRWVDLTVFVHGWNPVCVVQVPYGTSMTDGMCWWPREKRDE